MHSCGLEGPDCLEVVESFPKLRALYIGGNNIGNANLVHLSELTRLEELEVYSCGLEGPDCLDVVKNLTQLRVLTLEKNALQNANLEFLSKFKNLEKLNISNTHIENFPLLPEGLEYLIAEELNLQDKCHRLPLSLTSLIMYASVLNDADMLSLTRLINLQELGLPGYTTEEVMTTLKKSLPKTDIIKM